MFGIDWTDPAHYTIVLNTARVPVQECVDCIVRLVQSPAFAEAEESKAVLTKLSFLKFSITAMTIGSAYHYA
jgi:hypothetical protein